jgi:hypothetical protein
VKRVETNFAGRTLKIESGRLAKQAAGSCLVQFGETVVLAAVTVSENLSNLPYFPLTKSREGLRPKDPRRLFEREAGLPTMRSPRPA